MMTRALIMILQVLTSGRSATTLMPCCRKSWRADTRKLKDLRRLNGACGRDDLTRRRSAPILPFSIHSTPVATCL